ncbi:uncharacterized protein LOC131687485 [Topomyia yanbarensis]|uniref:uncharacterized protein LOC131687485 n=1 Tax=Topomyia yanbarensis TaxID=2498891 RepID=UPI00273B4F4D|nr:uncharacterized protein LOC131687485 [Topomyia yanbarensis]
MNTSKLIRICNSSRKKTFVKIIPTVANLFQKAQHFFNEEYARIVLEEDGSSIMENDVVDACADGGLVLMLLKKDESWTPFESSIDAASKASTFVYDDIQYLYDIESSSPTTSTLNSILQSPNRVSKSVHNSQSDAADECIPPKKMIQSLLPDDVPGMNLANQCEDQEPSCTMKRSFEQKDVTIEYELELDYSNEPVGSHTTSCSGSNLVALKRKTKIDASTAVLLSKFEIDWSSIPRDIVTQLDRTVDHDKESFLNETDYNRLVDHIVGQLRNITPSIPISTFRRVAETVSSMYSFFIDMDDDGMIIGNGSSSLTEKLKNRNSYLNRAHKSGQYDKKQKFGDDPMRQCRVGIKAEYSLSGEPLLLDNLLMKQLYENQDWDKKLLETTKCYLRYKIDHCPLSQLMENFPIVMKHSFIEYHFSEATGVRPDQFIENFIKKREKIIKVSQTYRDKNVHIADTAEDMDVMVGISRMLKEDISEIVCQLEEETSSDLINKLHPTIVIVGSTRQSYYIHAQNSRVSENFESFILAIQHLVMVYFVYYFSYPSNLSKTLEFLQLYFYKLNPFKGSRSKATLVGQQQRLVRALMLKIAKFKSTV